ncbi:MAG: metallophosphoesterase [Gammaproteobacteria bacterium]|nr:metallophosphoesterase [Gammaproteobacteria bacterium]
MQLFRLFRIFSVLLVAGVLLVIVLKISRMPWTPMGNLVQQRAAAAGLTLFAFGDSGTGGPEQRAVAAAMEARCRLLGGVDGLVLLGDIVYPAGVQSASDPLWQERVWDMYSGPCLGAVPIYPVLGNHDYLGNARAVVAHSRINPRWHFPHRFYEVRFGALLRLFAVDNWFYDFCLDPDRCAMAFLGRALEQGDDATRPWRIAISHYPLTSASAKGGAHRGGLRGWLTRPIVCGRIDAWLAGHAHHLEHRTLADCGIEHLVSGGGGKQTYKVRKDEPGVAFARQTHGFLEIEADPNQLRFRFFDSAGRGLYAFRRSRGS